MTPFATVAQYESRFGEVGANRKELLEECLQDASALIRTELDGAGIDWRTPSEDFADVLMRVTRSVANRIMPSGNPTTSIPVGATQMSATAGSYNRQFSFSTPYGTPKLLPSECRLLGISRTRAGWADLGRSNVRDDNSDADAL